MRTTAALARQADDTYAFCPVFGPCVVLLLLSCLLFGVLGDPLLGRSVGYRGSMVYVHRVSLDWDINAYLAGLRLEGLSSKTIYWRVR